MKQRLVCKDGIVFNVLEYLEMYWNICPLFLKQRGGGVRSWTISSQRGGRGERNHLWALRSSLCWDRLESSHSGPLGWRAKADGRYLQRHSQGVAQQNGARRGFGQRRGLLLKAGFDDNTAGFEGNERYFLTFQRPSCFWNFICKVIVSFF